MIYYIIFNGLIGVFHRNIILYQNMYSNKQWHTHEGEGVGHSELLFKPPPLGIFTI